MPAQTELEIVLKAKDEASRKLEQLSGKLKKFGDNATKVGKSLSLKLTAPIVALGAGVIKSSLDLDEAMDRIAAATGATGKDLVGLNKIFKNVSKIVPQTFDEVAHAVADLNVRFGITGKQLEKTTEQFLQFAYVQNADVADTTRSLTRLLNSLGIEAKDAGLTMDKLTLAQQKTGISANRLAQLVTEAGPAFEQLGFGLDRSIALFAQFEKVGARPTEVIGSLGRALNKLAAEGFTNAEEAFKEYMKRIKEAPGILKATLISNELFGARVGGKIADDIRAGKFEIDDFVKALQGAEGQTEKTAQQMVGFSEKMAMMKNRLLLAVAPLGDKLVGAFEKLMPYLEKAIANLGKLIDKFLNLPSWVHKTILVLTILLALLGPVLLIVGQMSLGINALIGIFSALAGILPAVIAGISAINAPVLIIIAVLAALGVAIYAIIKNLDKVKRAWQFTWLFIKEFVATTIEFIVGLILGMMDIFLPGWQEKLDIMVAFWKNAWELVKSIFVGIWGGIKSHFSESWQSIKDIMKVGVDFVIKQVERAKAVINSLRSAARRVGGAVSGAVSGIAKAGRAAIGFADGGIVRKPTLGMVGEAGPEAIVPLNRMKSLGITINVNLSNNTIMGGSFNEVAEEIGNAIFNKLNYQLRI